MLDEQLRLLERRAEEFQDFVDHQRLARLRLLAGKPKDAILEFGLDRITVAEGVSVEQAFIAEILGFEPNLPRKSVYRRVFQNQSNKIISKEETVVAGMVYTMTFIRESKG